MLKFLRMLRGTLFGKRLSVIVEVPPVEPIRIDSEVQITHEQKTQNKTYAAFAHSRDRLMLRYNLALTYDIWNGWISQIQNKNPVVVYVADYSGSSVYRV